MRVFGFTFHQVTYTFQASGIPAFLPPEKVMPEKEEPAGDITEELQKPGAAVEDALLDLVYAELHRQAHRYLQRERVGHTLQTTALVHEAYLKLSRQKFVEWESRSHFFGIAATLMRRILIDHAKGKQRLRRGGPQIDLRLDTALTLAVSDTNFDLLELNEALEQLAEKDPDLARVVELRFFAGLGVPETADVMGVSESTVKRGWAMAKAWLHRELTQ
jgi:RNA polymerase sigma-70 factor, ECF subfamily